MTNVGRTTPEGRASSRRWLGMALVVSLMVNMVVVGAIAGTVWSPANEAEWRSPSTSQHAKLGLRIYANNLPPDRREVVLQSIQATRERLAPLREEVYRLRREAGGVLGSEPFDKERLKSEMVRLVEAEAKLRAEIVKSFSDIVAKLTPEERLAYRQWRQQRQPPLFGGTEEKDRSSSTN